MENLRQKTISGLLWSSADTFAKTGLMFVLGVVLARLLSPREFGLVGMVSVFIAVAQTFVSSGFGAALIRKPDATEVDMSTVFFFNLAAGTALYAVMFASAPSVSAFYDEPRLTGLLRWLGLILIIDSFTLIQRTVLTKRVDFKLQTKITAAASLLSGAVGIGMALRGYGVWSLVGKTLALSFFTSVFFWIGNRWIPLRVFSPDSFRELFAFGSKLLASALINTVWQNVYGLVIGKYFSAADLGLFSRARSLAALPAVNLNTVFSRVTFPVLARLQHDPERMRSAARKILKSLTLVVFVSMLGLSASSDALVFTLLGAKWMESALYLKWISLALMLYPLHDFNLNLLKVYGRSDLFLRLEIYKKLLAVPVIVLGVIYGLKVMVMGMVFNSVIAYAMNSYWSGKFLNYPLSLQIRDILPSLGVAVGAAAPAYLAGRLLLWPPPVVLAAQVLLSAGATGLLCHLFKPMAYREILAGGMSIMKRKQAPITTLLESEI